MGEPKGAPGATSLRERSKAKRREAIRRAGMRLFAERGYEGATIADIAEAAEVAPRTVSMYFPSKADIALSVAADVAGRLTAVFEARPGVSFLAAVDEWLTGEIEHLDPELMALTAAMYEANPALRSLSSTEVADAAAVGGPAFAAEAGLPPEHPMTAVIGAAAGAAIAKYLTSGPDPDLHGPFMACLRAITTAAS
ncbi:TetR/AcrR family transcriptional regulator [Kitasatospora sp. NBC_01250]|uniref:TetR/AcrR family transcriptional regulator n=1 Tax=unclassified Kitasatospora TaxID=2633591 RepID=UPI002E0D1210|nr:MULTISPECIES: helix-turn-helix domain-containing protein [unclassified Kitasatospora]WSJ71617.1 TetR/AcrR family transcriptional regulator [Kitasatospora sp. NBC_01302]